jgi:hypothetical protein
VFVHMCTLFPTFLRRDTPSAVVLSTEMSACEATADGDPSDDLDSADQNSVTSKALKHYGSVSVG